MSEHINEIKDLLVQVEQLMAANDDASTQKAKVLMDRVEVLDKLHDRNKSTGPVAYYGNGGRITADSGPGGTNRARTTAPSGEFAMTAGFESAGDYLAAVVREGMANPNVARFQNSQLVSPPSSGGFLVPSEWSTELYGIMLENSIAGRVRNANMTAATMNYPTIDDADHSSAGIAGLEGKWLGEAATMSVDSVTFRSLELSANKLGILCRGSREYFQDGKMAEEFLKQVMSAAADFYLGMAIIRGTGAGQPLDILNAPGKIECSKDTGQTADTITWNNIINMYSYLTVGSKNVFWLASPSAKAQLLNLNQAIGTAGVGFYPALNQAGEVAKLLGFDVVYSEHMNYLGDAGDLALVSGDGYIFGTWGGVVIDTSMHPYFTSDQVAVRIIIRCDGQPVQSQYLTLRDGTHTTSDIVTLAERA